MVRGDGTANQRHKQSSSTNQKVPKKEPKGKRRSDGMEVYFGKTSEDSKALSLGGDSPENGRLLLAKKRGSEFKEKAS
jgi:hypothetical protein